MNIAAAVVAACLIQQGDLDPRYQPQLVPSRAASEPAAAVEPSPPEPPTVAPSASAAGLDPGNPSATAPRPESKLQTPTARSLAGVASRPQRMRPPEVLAEALANAKEDGLEGKPLALADVLRLAGDRPAQIKATHQYWQLVTAQAEFHFARARYEQWTALTKNQAGDASVRIVEASYAARAHDAHAAFLAAQGELTQLLHLPAGEPPLAADRPHVGAYDTKFEQIFSGRTAPADAVFVNRMLPVRRKAIDLRAAAIQAAQDALQGVEDEYAAGRADLNALTSALDGLERERRELLYSVQRYNDAIADYALPLAPAGLSETALVPRLIRVQAVSQVRPKPDLASPGANQDKPAGPDESSSPAEPASSDGIPKTFADPSDKSEPAATDRGAQQGSYGRGVFRLVPRDTADSPPPVQIEGGDYQGILETTPADRLEKLISLLHWDRQLMEVAGAPLTLPDALTRAGSEKWRPLIAAYWTTREAVASYQVLVERAEQLSLLTSLALQARVQPGGPAAMLRLQAARQAALADQRDAQAELIERQYELGRLTSGSGESLFPVPGTSPLARKHSMGASGDAPASMGSSEKRRSGELYGALLRQAEVVVLADAARAAVMSGPESGARELDRAIAAIQKQQQATLRLLAVSSAYNIAIAQWALTRPPAAASVAQLLQALGMQATGDTGA